MGKINIKQRLWKLEIKGWNSVLNLKFKGNKPENIPVPEAGQTRVRSVPLKEAYPKLNIQKVMVADAVPEDEASTFKHTFVALQLEANKIIPQMLDGLPQIDANPKRALDKAYSQGRRKVFPAPRLAEELQHEDLTDVLAALAISGPFAACLTKVGDNVFEWDFLKLNDFEHHAGLKKIGVKVIFKSAEAQLAPYPVSIQTDEGIFSQADTGWEDAVKLALCAVSSHTSLVRHFNGLHLACGAHVAIATRNELNDKHPIKRLIWPNMYGSQFSNDIVMMPQMGADGDFVNMFSFTHAGLCQMYDDCYDDYQITSLDPQRDLKRRGLQEIDFDLPTHANISELFDVFHRYATKTVEHYYVDDQAIEADAALSIWLNTLEQTIPHGITAITDGLNTRESLAELCASFMYLGAVAHEHLGTNLWNYQLWTHKIPCRCYVNGQREPVDVYQRVVNANFNLNVSRVQLIHDFSYLALDDVGVALFQEFQDELKSLNNQLRSESETCARLYPDQLEANMNA